MIYIDGFGEIGRWRKVRVDHSLSQPTPDIAPELKHRLNAIGEPRSAAQIFSSASLSSRKNSPSVSGSSPWRAATDSQPASRPPKSLCRGRFGEMFRSADPLAQFFIGGSA